MHGENSRSLAGEVNTTDPELFVSSRAHQGIRCRARRLGDAPERLALLSSINCLGSWRWSRATDEVRASKHARSIFGLDESAPLTRDMLLMTIHPEDRATVVRAIRATAHRGATGEMKIRVVGHDHAIRWVTSNVRAYRDPRGMLLRVTGYVIDAARRKQAEAESLKQQQQITYLTRVAMLGELSGALAHELQQPLTAILCNAQAAQLLAAKAAFNVGELRELLEDIVRDDKHAGQIIQHLRSLLMRGELPIQRIDIADVIRDGLTLARGRLTERNVQVTLRIDEGVSGVLGNRVELQQVLLNLMLNASEAMSANAPGDRQIQVVIALDAEQSAVRTSIIDCGKGIDRDQLDHIFEPFFTTKEGGLGLGLAVCRSIILAHKGRLWAANNSDRGAAFNFTLPVTTRQGQQ
jgi:two-component system, LuxR family, sensor kinase FixL